MPSLLQTNLPEIMQAVEAQLLSFIPIDTNVANVGSVSNIYWVFGGDEPPPGLTGQRDILLVERDDKPTNIVGEGRFAEMYAGLDINLRTSLASDRNSTWKDWMIKHAQLRDALLDAMMGFFPVDADQNAYTIEGFVLDTNSTPLKGDPGTWGRTVGTYRFHYLPSVNVSLLTT